MKMIEKIVKVNDEHILELWLKDQEWTTEMKMGARMYFQLRTFVDLAKHAKVAASFDMKNGNIPKGLFKEDLLNAGITEDTFQWLVKEHYVSYHEGRSLFLAFANKYHKDKTIDNLVKILDEFEKEILKK